MFAETFIYVVYFVSLFVTIFYLVTFFENKKYLKSKETNKFFSVSIIIPAYNKEAVIEDTIKSVLGLDYPKDKLEVILIDDGSEDNTYSIAKKYQSKNFKVLTKNNSGKAATLNFGINKSKGELILVLDADTLPNKDVLKKTVGYFKDLNVGAVVSTLQPYNPKKLIEKIQIVEYTLSSFSRKILSLNNSLSSTPACSVFRADIFRKYGGFDEDNLTEDYEMALRLQAHHYKVIHALDSTAYTDVPKNLRDLFRQRIRWCYGTFYNIQKYKKLFGRNYGDFGIFFFPLVVLSISMSLFMFSISIIDIITILIKKFHLLSLIGFHITFDTKYFSILYILTDLRIILGIIAFALALILFYLAKRYTYEKSNINIISYFIYAFIYSVFIILSWAISLGYYITKKKPQW